MSASIPAPIRRRHLLALGLAASAGPSPAHAAETTGDDLPLAARTFKRSYRDEAAGHTAAALDALSSLPADQRESYLVLLRRGWLLYLAGRHQEAIAAYTQALSREPGSIEARLGLLLPRIALAQWPAVEAGAHDVLAIDPANYLASLRLAFALYNQQKLGESERIYRRALARYPSDAELRSGVAWCLLGSGNAAAARKMFTEALSSAPDSALILKGLRACDGKP